MIILNKILIAGFILSTVNYFMMGRMLLALLAGTMLIGYLISSFAGASLAARDEMKKTRNTAYRMEEEGRSKEEILDYIDSPIDSGAEFSYDEVPGWLSAVTLLFYAGSIVLMVASLVMRLI